MTELKPCPFCGGEANFEQLDAGRGDHNTASIRFNVRCKKCDATAPKANGFITWHLSYNGNLAFEYDDREKAAEAWNRRADDESSV